MLCIENKDCEDLERLKIHQVLPDNEASKEGHVRVVDESGEDYPYPKSHFIPPQLPKEAQEALPTSKLNNYVLPNLWVERDWHFTGALCQIFTQVVMWANK
jgi:hypothetical protein